MRILISSVGTRGDVQPALALAIEIRRLNHEVRVCVPPNFVAWASSLGVEARPIGVEMRAPRPGEPPKAPPDLDALMRDQFDVVTDAARGCDLIVGAGVHQYAARSIAERLGAPFVIAAYAPISLPSSDLPPSGQATKETDPETIARMWKEHRQAWNARALDRLNGNRTRIGLAPVDDVLGHILGRTPWLAADPALAPAPTTPDMRVVQTGAWMLPDARDLPPELEAFLAGGEPPAYFGLGSMPAPRSAAKPLIDAARAVGRRVVISRGWADLEAPPAGPDVLTIDDVNHRALFERAAVVVHHGGAGTTTAAALAGAPQIVTPLFGDQFYFGERVCALGVGAMAPFRELDVDRVAAALDAALAPSCAARAKGLSGRIVSDGAAAAAHRLVSGRL